MYVVYTTNWTWNEKYVSVTETHHHFDDPALLHSLGSFKAAFNTGNPIWQPVLRPMLSTCCFALVPDWAELNPRAIFVLETVVVLPRKRCNDQNCTLITQAKTLHLRRHANICICNYWIAGQHHTKWTWFTMLVQLGEVLWTDATKIGLQHSDANFESKLRLDWSLLIHASIFNHLASRRNCQPIVSTYLVTI